MATARDVYNRAIALLDEISPDTGSVDVTTTAEFEARSPFLIDMLQKEIARIGRYRKTSDVTITADPTADPTDDYVEVTMPADLDFIEKVVVLDPPNNYFRKAFMVEGNAVYVHTMFDGVLRITYSPVLTEIDSLDDTLQVDAVSQAAMAWGLAKMLSAPEGNDFLTAFFSNEYEKQKSLVAQRKPVSFERVYDVYGGI